MKKLIKQITLKNNNLTENAIASLVKQYENIFRSKHANLVITDDTITFTLYSKLSYEALVNKLVREKYTDSEEFAILRKALTEKTNEFYIYNAYVEECKLQAKAFIEERNKALGV